MEFAISVQFLALIPVLVGVVQVVKVLGVGSRFLPLVSLLLGVGAVGALAGFDVASIIEGVVIGLSAVGLWSGATNTVGK